MKITQAQKEALRALYQAGDAVVQRSRLLAAGEWLPFAQGTYLKLIGAGLVHIEGNRLKCTDAGRQMAAALPAWTNMNTDDEKEDAS